MFRYKSTYRLQGEQISDVTSNCLWKTIIYKVLWCEETDFKYRRVQLYRFLTGMINLLEPEFYIQILAHPVCKMWTIQEPKKVAL